MKVSRCGVESLAKQCTLIKHLVNSFCVLMSSYVDACVGAAFKIR